MIPNREDAPVPQTPAPRGQPERARCQPKTRGATGGNRDRHRQPTAARQTRTVLVFAITQVVRVNEMDRGCWYG